jgi:HEAT repeats
MISHAKTTQTQTARESIKRVMAMTMGLGLGICLLLFAIDRDGPRMEKPNAPVTQATTAGDAIPQREIELDRETEDTTAPTGFYHAAVGQVCRFEWKADSTTAIHAAKQAGTSKLQVRLGGVMTTTVLARRGDEMIVELEFPKVTGTFGTNGQRSKLGQDALTSALATCTLLRMRDNGTTLGYAFAKSVGPKHRNFIRGLWTACRFVARDTRDAAWRTTEQDVIGTAELEYRWRKPILQGNRVIGGELHRRKLGYRQPEDAADSAHGTLTGEGEGTAHLNPDLGWFETARWTESVTRQIDEVGVKVVSSLSAQWRLTDVEWREIADTDALWRTSWQSVAAQAETGASSEADLANQNRERLRGATLGRLLADLELLLSQNASHADIYAKKLDLTWLLRLRPEAMTRLQGMLSGMTANVQGLAISAIGATELPGAQTFLAQLFGNAANSAAQRQAAAWSMMQVRKPQGASVLAFAKALSGRARMDDEGVAAGILALGTMLGRTDPAARDEAFATLVGLEAAAIREGALANWLEALGNAAVPGALPFAQRHRDHAAANVRAGAIAAVRRVAGGDALALVAAGLSDQQPAVRALAAEILATRAEPAALAAVERMLRAEKDARVRSAAVAALDARLRDPRARAMVARVARNDPDAGVRKMAAAILGRR